MKRFFYIFCVLLISSLMVFTSLAEDKGKPKLVDWFWLDGEKDAAYWDRLNSADRELTEEEYNPNETAPPPPESGEATQEQIAAYEEFMREQKEIAHESNLDAKPGRDKMMEMVFSDNLDLDQVKVPENCFEDKYAEYKGKDGSITRVYDNGSVSTKHPDGTFEAFDTWGNHYTTDKDGKETINLTDGNTLVSIGNDSYEWHGQDGSVITPHEDGSVSWENQSGIVIDYNEDGERIAIGFEHGDKMNLQDGMFPQGDGELKGPNGASITWHNGSTYLGDDRYSFKVIGEDGRGGNASYDPSNDYRMDKEATREKMLATNGEDKDHVMTSDTKVEVSSMDGNAWRFTFNNTKDDVASVIFEDSDGNVYTNQYLGDGFFKKSYESGDGKENYRISLDGNGLNSSYKDKDGEHTLIKTTYDDDGNVVIVYEDGGRFVINDETGTSDYTHPDGTTIHVTTDGDDQWVEYNNPTIGVSYIEKNGEIVSGSGPIGGGFQITVTNGETEIVTPTGEKIKVTEYSDGSMGATLNDGTEITKESGGSWMLDGQSMDSYTGSEEKKKTETTEAEEADDTYPAETPARTRSKKTALDIDAFMGTWVNEDGERTVLLRNGSNVIEKNPDLSWYGGDVSCMECTAECDGDTLKLKGITSWVCEADDLYSTDEKHKLEIDASSSGNEYTALNVEDGSFTEMTDGTNFYTRQ